MRSQCLSNLWGLKPQCRALCRGVRTNFHPSRLSAEKIAFRRVSIGMGSHCSGPEKSPPVEEESYVFGPFKINKREVFLTTKLSYAFVNLRPVVPGHVLVSPKRLVKRFTELTAEETTDLWLTAQQIGARLENHFKATSLTFAIQDGPEAGQTVPHVHIHILPRKVGDFGKNDDIYDAIDDEEKKLKEKLDLDKERKDRTADEMAQEADELRVLF